VTLASKEVERAALHETVWRIANDLRGSVDGWDLKSYVLGIGETKPGEVPRAASGAGRAHRRGPHR